MDDNRVVDNGQPIVTGPYTHDAQGRVSQYRMPNGPVVDFQYEGNTGKIAFVRKDGGAWQAPPTLIRRGALPAVHSCQVQNPSAPGYCFKRPKVYWDDESVNGDPTRAPGGGSTGSPAPGGGTPGGGNGGGGDPASWPDEFNRWLNQPCTRSTCEIALNSGTGYCIAIALSGDEPLAGACQIAMLGYWGVCVAVCAP